MLKFNIISTCPRHSDNYENSDDNQQGCQSFQTSAADKIYYMDYSTIGGTSRETFGITAK